jgi:hypothetical protein
MVKKKVNSKLGKMTSLAEITPTYPFPSADPLLQEMCRFVPNTLNYMVLWPENQLTGSFS